MQINKYEKLMLNLSISEKHKAAMQVYIAKARNNNKVMHQSMLLNINGITSFHKSPYQKQSSLVYEAKQNDKNGNIHDQSSFHCRNQASFQQQNKCVEIGEAQEKFQFEHVQADSAVQSKFLQTNQSIGRQGQQQQKKQDIKTNFHGQQLKQDPIVKICSKHLKVCSKMVKEGKISEAENIIQLIHKTLGELCSQQGLRWKMVKIKTTLVRAQIIFCKIEKQIGKGATKGNIVFSGGCLTKKESEFIQRIPIFCKQLIKQSSNFQFLENDYYSFVEILYFIAVRSLIIDFDKIEFGNKSIRKCQRTSLLTLKRAQIQLFLQRCRISLGKQLSNLCNILTQMKERKIFDIITQKCETLMKLFGLELSILYANQTLEKQSYIDAYSEYQIKENNRFLNFMLNQRKKDSQIQKKNQKFDDNLEKYKNELENIESVKSSLKQLKDKIWAKYEKIINIVPQCIQSQKMQLIVLQAFVQNAHQIQNNLLKTEESKDTQDQGQKQIKQKSSAEKQEINIKLNLRSRPSQTIDQYPQWEDELWANVNFQPPKLAATKQEPGNIEHQPQIVDKPQKTKLAVNQQPILSSIGSLTDTLVTDEQNEKLSTAKELCLAHLYEQIIANEAQKTMTSRQAKVKDKNEDGSNISYSSLAQRSQRNRYLSVQYQITTQQQQKQQTEVKQEEANEESKEKQQDKKKNVSFNIKPSILIKRSNKYLDKANIGEEPLEISQVGLDKIKASKKSNNLSHNDSLFRKDKSRKKVTIIQSANDVQEQKVSTNKNMKQKQTSKIHLKTPSNQVHYRGPSIQFMSKSYRAQNAKNLGNLHTQNGMTDSDFNEMTESQKKGISFKNTKSRKKVKTSNQNYQAQRRTMLNLCKMDIFRIAKSAYPLTNGKTRTKSLDKLNKQIESDKLSKQHIKFRVRKSNSLTIMQYSMNQTKKQSKRFGDACLNIFIPKLMTTQSKTPKIHLLIK